MMTQTCILKFSDGIEVRAWVAAATPYDENPVQYAGPANRLSRQWMKATPADLRMLFGNQARELGAEYSESSSGEFDQAE